MYVYIYIYIYTSMYTYIYIYIYTHVYLQSGSLERSEFAPSCTLPLPCSTSRLLIGASCCRH